jgi:hypothetical protein
MVMAETVACPTCGKRFAAQPELMGRRVRCRACGAAFVVGADETRETFDLADVPDEPVAAATPPPLATRWAPPPRVARAKPVPSTSSQRPAVEFWALSDGERAWLKMCGGIVVFGIVGAILPLFGLQFRRLAGIGPNPVLGALGVSAAAVVFALLMFVRKVIKGSAKVAFRVVVWGVGSVVSVLALIALVGLLAWMPWSCSSGRGYAGPRNPSTVPPMPAPPALPRGSQAPADYEAFVGRFGADHVVRVRVRGSSGSKDPTHQRVRDALRRIKVSTWRGSGAPGGAEYVYIAAPVVDLDAFVREVGPGPEMTVDRAARMLTLDLSATRPAAE